MIREYERNLQKSNYIQLNNTCIKQNFLCASQKIVQPGAQTSHQQSQEGEVLNLNFFHQKYRTQKLLSQKHSFDSST